MDIMCDLPKASHLLPIRVQQYRTGTCTHAYVPVPYRYCTSNVWLVACGLWLVALLRSCVRKKINDDRGEMSEVLHLLW